MISNGGNSRKGRLDSWKEIAAHLNRSVRTVVRWEQEEGLPVHRHSHEKRGSIYAFRLELDEWLARREAARPTMSRWRFWASGAAVALLAVTGFGWWYHQPSFPPTTTPSAEAPADLLGASNHQAFREYLRARHAWNKRTSEGIESAIRHYRTAIDLDPVFARAYAALGEAYALQSYYTPSPPSESAPRARAAALKAISINPRVAEAHGVLGYVQMDYFWEWGDAGRNFQRALELDPRWADGHHWYGEYLVAMGRYPEALAAYASALELDPLSPIITTNIAHAHYFSRAYDRAEAQCRRALVLDPAFPNAHADLGRALLFLGQSQEAVAEAEAALKLGGGAMNGLSRLGFVYARTDRKEQAMRIAAELQAMHRRGWGVSFGIALLHAGLGDRDSALDWLERAYAERAPYLRMIWNEPALDGLRDHPRYLAIVKRMHLPPEHFENSN